MSEVTAELCREARLKHNFTQQEFADLLGVNPMTVSRWERGTSPPPRPTYILLTIIYRSSRKTVEEIRDFRPK